MGALFVSKLISKRELTEKEQDFVKFPVSKLEMVELYIKFRSEEDEVKQKIAAVLSEVSFPYNPENIIEELIERSNCIAYNAGFLYGQIIRMMGFANEE